MTDDVDVLAGLEAGEADHPLGEVVDPHRLAHLEHVDGGALVAALGAVLRGAALAVRMRGRRQDEVRRLSRRHEVAHHVRDG